MQCADGYVMVAVASEKTFQNLCVAAGHPEWIENPLFKKVLDSQRAFAQRAGQWQNDYMVDFKMAYNHYFGKGAKKG